MSKQKSEYQKLVDRHSGIKVGYTKTEQERVEGEQFEEGGKTWVIKNGIKTSVSKLKQARQFGQMPLTCPNCGQRMEDNTQNMKSWLLRGYCFNCLIKHDNDLVVNGQFKQFEREEMIKNVKAYTESMKQELQEYIKDYKSKKYITEDGDIEEWSSDPEMEVKINQYCDVLEQQCIKIIEDLNKE